MAAKFPHFIGFLVSQTQLEVLEDLAAAQDCTHSEVLRAYLEQQAATHKPLAPTAEGSTQHNAHER